MRLRPPSALEIERGSRVVVSTQMSAGARGRDAMVLGNTPAAEASLESVAETVRQPECVTVVLAARRAGGSRENARAAFLPELKASLDGVIMPAVLSETPGVNDQELVFAACRDTIASVAFRGRSGTIFAYGPTGEPRAKHSIILFRTDPKSHLSTSDYRLWEDPHNARGRLGRFTSSARVTWHAAAGEYLGSHSARCRGALATFDG